MIKLPKSGEAHLSDDTADLPVISQAGGTAIKFLNIQANTACIKSAKSSMGFA